MYIILSSGPCKSVSWRLGSDGDVHVCIIGESNELKSPKLILSELRDKTAANPNNINRYNALYRKNISRHKYTVDGIMNTTTDQSESSISKSYKPQ